MKPCDVISGGHCKKIATKFELHREGDHRGAKFSKPLGELSKPSRPNTVSITIESGSVSRVWQKWVTQNLREGLTVKIF